MITSFIFELLFGILASMVVIYFSRQQDFGRWHVGVAQPPPSPRIKESSKIS